MILSEAWKLYEGDKRLLGYSPHTLNAYQIQSNLLIRHIGDIEIEDVTHVALKEYLIKQEHLKPASIGHRIKFIRAFFRYLHEEGFIERNVSSKLKEPKQGARIPKALNTEEVELLRDACSSSLEKALMEFFYASGCRIGEVHGLNIKDVNWQTGQQWSSARVTNSARCILLRGAGFGFRSIYNPGLMNMRLFSSPSVTLSGA